MKNVAILRLKEGNDIICTIDSITKKLYNISNPMIIYTDIDEDSGNPVLMMHNWSPVEIIKHNTISIHEDNIICKYEPIDKIYEFYLTTSERFETAMLKRNFLRDNVDMNEEEILDILDAFDELKTLKPKLH